MKYDCKMHTLNLINIYCFCWRLLFVMNLSRYKEERFPFWLCALCSVQQCVCYTNWPMLDPKRRVYLIYLRQWTGSKLKFMWMINRCAKSLEIQCL